MSKILISATTFNKFSHPVAEIDDPTDSRSNETSAEASLRPVVVFEPFDEGLKDPLRTIFGTFFGKIHGVVVDLLTDVSVTVGKVVTFEEVASEVRANVSVVMTVASVPYTTDLQSDL